MIDATFPPEPVLEELGRAECLELVRTQSVGRLAVADHGHYPPHIVPVNFAVEGDRVVFRSSWGLKFRLSVLAEHSVSFEVDFIDHDGHLAWSVVVQGRAELLRQDAVDALVSAKDVRPWAPGERPEWIQIVPYLITGRRLRNLTGSPATG
jgi:nitroimidazol reductase NimA-like FMN-containing flavoprotein (pyridoxamine 5'-phosphate oxidase superfamily)